MMHASMIRCIISTKAVVYAGQSIGNTTTQKKDMIWRSWKFLNVSRRFNPTTSTVARRTRSSLTSILLLGTLSGSCCFAFMRNHSALQGNYNADDDRFDSSSSDVTERNHHRNVFAGSFLLATSASRVTIGGSSQTRTFATDVDDYFQKFQQIPSPPIMHESLDRMLSADTRNPSSKNENKQVSNKILVIGDVHGCLNELKSLVAKAMNDHNEGKLFAAVVLVGDLCNKGPYSAEVINFVRNERNWFSVRGNHDNHALATALGDENRRMKPKYKWVHSLSDNDVVWMSKMPYTITIPGKMMNQCSRQDVIVVHAGFIPDMNLVDQEIQTMTMLRDVIIQDSNRDETNCYKYYKPCDVGNPKAWAKSWEGPELVIFGHDAKRGLQREKYAIGLDSGACYGKKLTGIILPEKELVSVDAERVHCPVK